MKVDQLENVNKELKSLETIIKDYQIDVDKDLFDNLKKSIIVFGKLKIQLD